MSHQSLAKLATLLGNPLLECRLRAIQFNGLDAGETFLSTFFACKTSLGCLSVEKTSLSGRAAQV